MILERFYYTNVSIEITLKIIEITLFLLVDIEHEIHNDQISRTTNLWPLLTCYRHPLNDFIFNQLSV